MQDNALTARYHRPSPEPKLILSERTETITETHSGITRRPSPNPANADHESTPFIKHWLWEIVAAVAGLIFMVTLIVTLTQIGGVRLEPLYPGDQHYWQYTVQPNTLVSVLATITTTLLFFPVAECISQSKWIHFRRASHQLVQLEQFDAASRGLLGSLKLLICHRGAGSWAAAIGALVTIAMSVVDPFTQQVISYPSRLEYLRPSSSLNVQTSTAYLGATEHLAFTGDYDEFKYTLDTVMQGAIVSAVYSIPSFPMSHCSTGDCIWEEPLVSLGICSSCQDVTNTTTHHCASSAGAEDAQTTVVTTQCDHKTPNGVSFATYEQAETSNDETYKLTGWNKLKTGVDNKPASGPCASDEMSCLVTVATYLADDTGNIDSTKVYDGRAPGLLPHEVSECNLYWCAHVYNGATVTNGTLNARATDPVASYQLKPTKGPQLLLPDNLHNLTGNYNLSVELKQQDALTDFLANLFDITLVNVNDADLVHQFPEANSPGFSLGPMLFEKRDMAGVFDDVAAGMTNRIRHSGQYRMGTEIKRYTVVKVDWRWVSLPLAWNAAVIAYLITLMLKTKRAGAVAWKSSSLALLFHALQGFDEGELDVQDVERMMEAAGRMEAQAVKVEEGGLEFVKA